MTVLLLIAAQMTIVAPDVAMHGMPASIVTGTAQAWDDGFHSPACAAIHRIPVDFALVRKFNACRGFTGCLIATARDVKADWILSGGLERSGGKHGARLSVTLIDVKTRQAEQIVSGSYDGVSAIQRAVRKSVADACASATASAPFETPPPPVVAAKDIPLDLPLDASPTTTTRPTVAATEPGPSTQLPIEATQPQPQPAKVRLWPRSQKASTLTAVFLGLSGGMAIAGGAFGGSAVQYAQMRDAATAPPQFNSLQSGAETRGILANAAFGVSAAAAVVAVVFWARGDAIFGDAGAGGDAP